MGGFDQGFIGQGKVREQSNQMAAGWLNVLYSHQLTAVEVENIADMR